MQERVKAKTTVTLDIDASLVAAAREKGLDLSVLVEQALMARLAAGEARGLSDEDRRAIEDHNRFIAQHGTLADSLRDLR